MNIFTALVWAGTALTLIGLCALIWCILAAVRLRRSALPDPEIRAGMRRVVAVNLGALAASSIGLMLVILGLFLR